MFQEIFVLLISCKDDPRADARESGHYRRREGGARDERGRAAQARVLTKRDDQDLGCCRFARERLFPHRPLDRRQDEVPALVISPLM